MVISRYGNRIFRNSLASPLLIAIFFCPNEFRSQVIRDSSAADRPKTRRRRARDPARFTSLSLSLSLETARKSTVGQDFRECRKRGRKKGRKEERSNAD